MDPEFVLCFAFSENLSHIVLIEKNHPDFLADQLNGVGGTKQDHQTLMDCVLDEFESETGVKTKSKEWHYVDAFDNIFGRKVAVFCSSGKKFLKAKTMMHKIPTKTEAVFVLPVEEIVDKKLAPGVDEMVHKSINLLRNRL